MTRILHVISSLVGGGAETQLKLLMEKSRDKNLEVGVIFLYDDKELSDRRGITFYKLSRGRKKSVNKGFCHVQFASMSSAIKAVKGDGSQIMGRRVQIDFASLKNEDDEDSFDFFNDEPEEPKTEEDPFGL